MAITATFSNGFVDVYKGKRSVKAAWMITRKSDGKVLNSGHSLDAAKALKTAEGYVAYCGTHVLDEGHPLYQAHWIPRWHRYTFAEATRMRAHNAARTAAIRALVKIEVIAL